MGHMLGKQRISLLIKTDVKKLQLKISHIPEKDEVRHKRKKNFDAFVKKNIHFVLQVERKWNLRYLLIDEAWYTVWQNIYRSIEPYFEPFDGQE